MGMRKAVLSMLSAALLCPPASAWDAEHLDRLKAELKAVSGTRRLQQVDCSTEPEAACIATPMCEAEAATCEPAAIAGEPAGACALLAVEPECDADPGCTWSAFPGCVPIPEPVEPEAEPEAATAWARADAEPESGSDSVGSVVFYGLPWGVSVFICCIYLCRCHRRVHASVSDVPRNRWWVADSLDDASDDGLVGDPHLMFEKMVTFHDRPVEVIKIIWSSVGVMAFCPGIMLTYTPLVDYLWEDMEHPGMDINDPVGIFLAPAGLVYALLFAYMYDLAQTKWNETSRLFQQEMTHVRHMLIMAIIYQKSCADDGCLGDQLESSSSNANTTPDGASFQIRKVTFIDSTCKIVNGLCLRTLLELRGEGEQYGGPNEWDLVPLLTGLSRRVDGSVHEITGATEQLYAMLMELVSGYEDVRATRAHVAECGVHLAQWAIIELLSLFMFYGILLMRGGSTRFEFLICVVTSISIALLSLVTADLDSPFHGLIKIRLDPLAKVITLVDETILRDCIFEGEDCDWVFEHEDLQSFKEARATRARAKSKQHSSERWKPGMIGGSSFLLSSPRQRATSARWSDMVTTTNTAARVAKRLNVRSSAWGSPSGRVHPSRAKTAHTVAERPSAQREPGSVPPDE